jgi:hypothetical protein
MRKVFSGVLYDARTLAFLLGMGLEAAGIAIQTMLNLPMYPVLDVLTVGVLIVIIAYFQRKRHVQQIANKL